MVPNTYHSDNGEDAFGNDLGADVPGLHLDIDRGAEKSKIKPLHDKKRKKENSSPKGQRAIRALQSAAAAVFLVTCIAGASFLAFLGAWGFGAPLETVLLPLMEEKFSVAAPYSSLAEKASPAKEHQKRAQAAQKRGDSVGELLQLRRAQSRKGSDDKTRSRIRKLVEELNAKGSLRGG
ncbi:MAG: hypothetical protein GY822_16215 [Deltaproteobacteria bacterium]|nr:hypothetical protein [Deltaproteobacteria bacterium]